VEVVVRRWKSGLVAVLGVLLVTIGLVGAQAFADDERRPTAAQSDPVPGGPRPTPASSVPESPALPAGQQPKGNPGAAGRPGRGIGHRSFANDDRPTRASKAQRTRSRTAHRDVSKAEAFALLRTSAGDVLDAQPSPPADAKLEQVLNPRAVRVRLPEGAGPDRPTQGIFLSSTPFAIPGGEVRNGPLDKGQLADPTLVERKGRLRQRRAVTRHVGPGGQVSYRSGPVRAATHADLRLVAQALARRGR
jgi:hypothetical protein